MANTNYTEPSELTPFQKCVLQNFPFIEEDFDALTNYGLLCKVVEYLNKIIAQQNIVTADVKEFYEWFDNLDVQNEINNKLDQMATDGSLTELIKKYVDPIYQAYEENINTTVTAQNTKIATIETKVDGVASGSPADIYETFEDLETDNPDHNRIYLISSTGEWAYWSVANNSWENGGTYQSTGIADGSVTYNSFNDVLQNSFDSETTTTSNKANLGYYIATDGSIVHSGNENAHGYYELSVNPLDIYEIYVTEDLSYIPETYPAYILKKDDTTIQTVKLSNVTLTSGYMKITLRIPYNCNKLLVNTAYPVNGYILKVNKYDIYNIDKEQFDSKLQSVFKDQYEEVSPIILVPNAYYQGGFGYASYTGSDVYYLDVIPGEKYKITCKQIYTNLMMCYMSNNISNDITVNDLTYNVLKGQENIKDSESSHQFTDYEFTIPKYCNKIYINKEKSDTLIIKKATSYKIIVSDVDEQSIKDLVNPLKGKVLGFVGDSVLAASTSGVKGWTVLMQESNPETTFYNYGHDGYTIGYRSDMPDYSIQGRLDALLQAHTDLNYVIIQGGINDYYQSQYISLGSVNSTNFTTFDRTTFAGGLETMIKKIRDTIPTAKIGFIATHKILYADTIYKYYDIAKTICDKWSIGYCDLYHRGQLNMLIMAENYSINGDGTHPNLAGYQIETPVIENWLKYNI